VAGLCSGNVVFPVKHELNINVLSGRNSVFKGLQYYALKLRVNCDVGNERNHIPGKNGYSEKLSLSDLKFLQL
jgi:hypothetical protein